MKTMFNKLFTTILFGSAIVFASCNKDVEDPTPLTTPVPTGLSLLESITADSTGAGSLKIFRAAITRASTSTAAPSLATLLADRTAQFTVFAPTDAAFGLAFQALGIPPNIGINALRPGQLDTILRYHIVGGKVSAGMISDTVLNIQLPTLFALAPPSSSIPPGLRQSLFASRRGTNYWVNNVPLVQTDVMVANGVLHKPAVVLLPPSQFLWNRIDTDPNLTYLKAAIQRADSGVVAASTLQAALSNPAANFTVFAPTNLAFQQILTAQITLALRARGLDSATAVATATSLASTPGVFANPLLSSVLTPLNVQGLVVYHLLGEQVPPGSTTVNGLRVFSVNIPTTPRNVRTYLNRGIAAHPGVTVQATFGPTGVTAASVRGVFNPAPSNIQINPTPAPGGTSDQHYINGVLHVIDQVLRPQ